jgi:hypothetical protein
MAERQGFEPWMVVKHTRSPGVRLKPLGHLSGHNYVAASWLYFSQIANLTVLP